LVSRATLTIQGTEKKQLKGEITLKEHSRNANPAVEKKTAKGILQDATDQKIRAGESLNSNKREIKGSGLCEKVRGAYPKHAPSYKT